MAVSGCRREERRSSVCALMCTKRGVRRTASIVGPPCFLLCRTKNELESYPWALGHNLARDKKRVLQAQAGPAISFSYFVFTHYSIFFHTRPPRKKHYNELPAHTNTTLTGTGPRVDTHACAIPAPCATPATLYRGRVTALDCRTVGRLARSSGTPTCASTQALYANGHTLRAPVGRRGEAFGLSS